MAAARGDDDVTLGEVFRGLQQLRADFSHDLEKIEEQIRGLAFVSQATYDAERQAFEKRLAEVEKFKSWLLYGIAASVLAAVMGLVLVTSGGMTP